MKKVFYLAVIIFITVSVFSCTKVQENYATSKFPQPSFLKDEPGGGISISLEFKAGHDGVDTDCIFPYVGDVFFNGAYHHVPCVGKGDNCTWTISISFDALPDPVILDTLYSGIVILSEGKSEKNLPMPARSFLMEKDLTSGTAIGVSVSDTGTWINMPEQSWVRIDSTHYSLSTGCEFDTIPEYIDAP